MDGLFQLFLSAGRPKNQLRQRSSVVLEIKFPKVILFSPAGLAACAGLDKMLAAHFPFSGTARLYPHVAGIVPIDS
jgi:hypothetical protein